MAKSVLFIHGILKLKNKYLFETMSNIRGLGDIKKNEPGQGRGRGAPQPNDQMQGQGGFGGFPGLASLLGFGGGGQQQQGAQATWDYKVIFNKFLLIEKECESSEK